MTALKSEKSASRRFFLLCLLSLCTTCQPALAADSSCPSDRYDESATVEYVHDGDTVKLDDGRSIRLIGINAPEVAKDGRPAEAYALEARDQLRTLLHQHNNQVRLVRDQEAADHYQRALAHLFLPDGSSIAARLLSEGLASAITIPPNDRFADCYRQAETQARCAQRALWSKILPSVAELQDAASGFHVLRGKLLSIQPSSKGIWLNLEHGLSLRIAPPQQALFDLPQLQSLIGQRVIVRGWLQTKKQPQQGERFYMEIKHPSSLTAENIALKC